MRVMRVTGVHNDERPGGLERQRGGAGADMTMIDKGHQRRGITSVQDICMHSDCNCIL